MKKFLLEKAINLATKAHAGQFDKLGMPYILHPLRVMENVQNPLIPGSFTDNEHYHKN